MLELAPAGAAARRHFAGPGTAATKGERRARVILLAGCAQQVLRPEINDATIRLLARRGVDVEVAPGAGCCGALVHHMGREADAHRHGQAQHRRLDAGDRQGRPLDAVIVNASGCGTTVKDYGHLLRRSPSMPSGPPRSPAWRATSPSSSAATTWARRSAGRRCGSRIIRPAHAARPAHHRGAARSSCATPASPCVEIPEGHLCCGSAGTYNILQPAIAADLRERKVDNISAVRPDLVATGNIGCITQLASGMDIPIAHTVELLDWAYGGPMPRGLEALAKHVKDVPEAKPLFAVT